MSQSHDYEVFRLCHPAKFVIHYKICIIARHAIFYNYATVNMLFHNSLHYFYRPKKTLSAEDARIEAPYGRRGGGVWGGGLPSLQTIRGFGEAP